MGSSNLLDPGSSRQVQAQAQRDDRADDERFLDVQGATPSGLASEVETAKWVGFPEIDSRTEPVVIVVALLEELAFQDSFANGPIASVVTENETRSQLMQGAAGNEWLGPVVLAELAGFRIDPRPNQYLHRRFLGPRPLLRELRR